MRAQSTAIRLSVAALCVGLLSGLGADTAKAADYPSKLVRIIVAGAPGGSPDFLARLFATQLTEAFGQQVIVENRPGAGGNIGTEQVAKSAPDGYTLMLGSSFITVSASLYKNLGYDARKDLTPIAQLASVSNVLVVKASSPITSAKGLVAQAKAESGKLNFGSVGVGTTLHLNGELLKIATNTQMVHVPFKGWAEAMNAMLNGETHFMFDSTAASIGNIREKKTRALAVTSLQRDPALPDVPTMAEEGFPTVDGTAWFGILAPRGVPADVVQRVETELRKIYDKPETRAAMEKIGLKPDFMPSQQFSTYFAADIEKWAVPIRAANIVAE